MSGQADLKDCKIGICLPTRGVIDTLTIESIMKNSRGFNCEFYFTHNLPLPHSRTNVAERAMKDKCDFLWWVDDDMVIPDNHLEKLLEVADKETISASAYYMQNGKTSIHYEDGEAVQCGFGCALIPKEAFEKMPQPWFLCSKTRTDNSGDINWVDDKKSNWGGEDIWFYYNIVNYGFKIKEIKPLVGHLRIRTWGNKYLNEGCHDIYFLGKEGQVGFAIKKTEDEWAKSEKEYIDRVIENIAGESERLVSK